MIKSIRFADFMLFDELYMEFSPNINIISGDNSSGKTIILKTLYSLVKSIHDANKAKSDLTKEQTRDLLVNKLKGLYKPDEDRIGRLVRRDTGRQSTSIVITIDEQEFSIGFSSNQDKNISLDKPLRGAIKTTPVYIPPKEIISFAAHLIAIYDDNVVDIEEMYVDLAKLLMKPLKKGPRIKTLDQINTILRPMLKGDIIFRGSKFYLRTSGKGEFEMGLLSEGHRKLATIVYLVLSGSIGKDTVLFWDEPETNLNPHNIEPIVRTLHLLSKMGVQIFVATHDYFLQKFMSLYADNQPKKDPQDIRFISLFEESDKIKYEYSNCLSDLNRNPIMDEFINLYNKEQDAFYADT